MKVKSELPTQDSNRSQRPSPSGSWLLDSEFPEPRNKHLPTSQYYIITVVYAFWSGARQNESRLSPPNLPHPGINEESND
jgi:hypothetical protein